MKRKLAFLVVALSAIVFLATSTQLDIAVQIKGILPVVNGGTSSTNTTAALTPGTTVAVDFSNTASIYTLTPGQAETINASNCSTGLRKTVIITTSGTSSFVLTFSTNFKAAGTLATGTVTAKQFAVSFVCNGTTATETGRTAAM